MLRRTMLAATMGLLAIGAAKAQIPIAVVGPMTGSSASTGAQFRAGAEMAVADINKAGGVLGKQLVLEIGDDACDPKQAVSVANQMAGRKVVMVAGHYCSGSSIPASKVYEEEGVLQISPGSTNPKYTDEGGWNTFRVCGRDDQQGAVAGKYLAAHFKGKKVAVLNDNSAYGKGLADETEKNMKAAGLQPTIDATYAPGERDYSALISRMKQAGIDAVFIGGYHIEAGLITRQAKEQGMNATVIGGDDLVTSDYWQVSGPAGAGTLMTFPADPRTRPAAKSVLAEFKAMGFNPEGYTLYTYAAIQTWAAGARKANSTDPMKVAASLHGGMKVETVIGPLAFDKKGDITASDYVLYIWKDGNYSQL